MANTRRYRAFISYSHADKAVAEWLHRALERYRLPSRLVGQQTGIGPVPARLTPIFRDRDELSAAGHLSDTLRQALADSDFLIVIASVDAAASRWVDEEVRLFKSMHGESRVLALIAAGNPGERDITGFFPPAQRFQVDREGRITDRETEPVAADLRIGADGKRLAKLKLVAGLTGLPLDALVQREAARRQRWLMGIASASLALVAVMAVLTVAAIQGQREAERQRAEADGLVEYMLTDLRQKLEPVGRLDVLDSVGRRALAYYEGQRPASLDADALGRRARALMLVAEVRELNGDGTAALEAYAAAEESTAELLARDPDNPDRMFDHAQSVFYVGQVAWQRRDWDIAEARFRQYAALAERMLATDPSNPKWKLETGYAANSLGALYLDLRRPDDAITQFQRYVAVTDQLAAEAPGDTSALWDSSQARAWLADAFFQSGNSQAAEAERMAELTILTALRAADPRNSSVRMSMARAHDALATNALAQGAVVMAATRARDALVEMQALLDQDPANSLWRDIATSAANTRAEALLLDGQWAEARGVNAWALTNALELTSSDPANRRWTISLLMQARWMEVAILFGERRTVEARAGLARFQSDFGASRSADVERGAATAWLAIHAMEAADRAANNDPAKARAAAAAAGDLVTPVPGTKQQALLELVTAQAAGQTALPAVNPGRYPAHALIQAIRP
ncbi:toll/interleukin-1 receptor domain-containing protein [Thioalkalivibrio sp. XN279]|uniref:TIR domain-containing protein n=1 Tax=Thioalkalivibrio sp. XN279 TaxID=2714953 RepID=UPI00140905C1|nr:toll/interleukin-1 receptor domain-containing protein [Thioalkalivibrio sp. XN279]